MNSTYAKSFVPLSKVVKSSILDSFEDIGKMEQLSYHWAKRGLDVLHAQVLRQDIRKAFLPVNHNTNTATLPVDFSEETFVGVVDNRWMKVPLKSNSNLVNINYLKDIPDSRKCSKCGQDKSICEDLQITETANLIVINDTTYEQHVVKKLYPTGDYYLETTTPFLNRDGGIDYNTTKQFITHLDLKSCGCLDDTDSNISKLQENCPDCYCCYYAGCDTSCSNEYGSYRIFEENGLIQLDKAFKFDKVYIEYTSTIPKINGQFQVPQVAFETLVEWIKFKSVEGKKSVSNPDKRFRWDMYLNARRNMEKILGRVSLDFIIEVASRTPKFDVSVSNWYGWFDWNTQAAAVSSTAASSSATVTNTNTNTSSSTVVTITNNVESDAPKGQMINGLQLDSQGAYVNTAWAGYDLFVFYNGMNRYLTSNEYTLLPSGGIRITTGIQYTQDDFFIITPNGKI